MTPPHDLVSRLRTSLCAPSDAGLWGPALLGLVLTVLLFQPGYLTVDATFQMLQALGLEPFNDWHSPVMAWVWRTVAKMTPGTFGMFLLQELMYWGGLVLIAHSCLGRSLRAGLAVLCVGLWPPLLANLGAIWKDVQMVAALLLAVGLLLRAQASRSRWAFVAAQLPLLYALMLRHNALGALLPLHVWVAALGLRLWGRAASRRAVVLATCALLAGHVGCAQLLVRTRIRPVPAHPAQCVLLHDLAAVSLATGHSLLPDYLTRRGFGLPELALGFREDTVDYLVFPNFDRILTTDPVELASLRSAWLGAVTANPGAYARHRWRVFRAFLALGRPQVHIPVVPNVLAPHLAPHRERLGVPEFAVSPWNAKVTRALERLGNSVLFRPWVYLLLALAMAARLAWRKAPGTGAALALAVSNVLYACTYLPGGPAPDFRYALWMVASALLVPLVWRGAPALAPRADVDDCAGGGWTPAARRADIPATSGG